MFEVVEGGFAILHSRGVYTHVPLYVRGDAVYAGFGKGYVRLYGSARGTSKDKVLLDQLGYEGELFADAFGRLFTAAGAGRRKMPGEAGKRLLVSAS